MVFNSPAVICINAFSKYLLVEATHISDSRSLTHLTPLKHAFAMLLNHNGVLHLLQQLPN